MGDAYPGEAGKRKILEMYMNQVYYGNQAYGIAAAVDAYFGKDITSSAPEDQVTLGEAAMVVGLVRAPSRLDPTTEAVRADRCAGQHHPGRARYAPEPRRCRASCCATWSSRATSPRPQADAAADEEIVLAPAQQTEYKAPHFVYAVRREAADLLGSEELLDTAASRSPPPSTTTATRSSPRNGRRSATTSTA